MEASSKRLFLGLAALAFMALCLFNGPYEPFGSAYWFPGWFLSRLTQAALIAGGLTLVITYFFSAPKERG